jgi:hypothetical protein
MVELSPGAVWCGLTQETFRNMPFITLCRKAFASLSLKGSRLLRSYIFACYGLATPPESEPFTFFPTRKPLFRRISRK